MKIYSNNIVNGYLQDAFGKRGKQFIAGRKPSRSFHLAWRDLPQGTESLALVFIDHDAIPVCGFSWIHWVVANIDPKLQELPENASLDMQLTQGVTSWSSSLLADNLYLDPQQDMGYGGSAPPDKTHSYLVTLYALDSKLKLEPGFYLNELLHAIDGHILAEVGLTALYNA